MEVTDEDELVGFDNLDEEYEPGHINQLVEVLQARAKYIRDSKKKIISSYQTLAKSIQQDENQSFNHYSHPSQYPKLWFLLSLHLPNPFYWLCPHPYQPQLLSSGTWHQ